MSTSMCSGHVLRQRLDVEVAQVVLDHTALLDADRVTDLVDRNVDRDLLGTGHGQEVDVDQRVVDVIALDLTGHGQVWLAVHDQVEQHVGTAGGMQHVEHLARVDGQGHGLLIVPVEHRGHAARRTELAGHTFPVVVATFGFQLGFHDRVLEESRGSAAYRTG